MNAEQMIDGTVVVHLRDDDAQRLKTCLRNAAEAYRTGSIKARRLKIWINHRSVEPYEAIKPRTKHREVSTEEAAELFDSFALCDGELIIHANDVEAVILSVDDAMKYYRSQHQQEAADLFERLGKAFAVARGGPATNPEADFWQRQFNGSERTLQKIQDALDTAETGPALVALALDARLRSEATACPSGTAHSGPVTVEYHAHTDAYVDLKRGGDDIGTVLTKDAEEIVCALDLFSDLLDTLHAIANTSMTLDDCRSLASAALTKVNDRMSGPSR